MIDYEGKSVLVTGAASGIGAALAGALGARGARVLCADRNAEGAQQIAGEITGDAEAISCDLATPGAAAELIDQAFEIGGHLDLVCSNAGVSHRGRVARSKFDDDDRLSNLLEVNFFAGLKLAQAYARRLEEAGERGRLLVTASETALSVPTSVRASRLAFYGATKHALLNAMEWYRIEQEQGPLALHVLLPGAVYTPLISDGLPEPSQAPAKYELLMPPECADIALRGMDLDLFYIPTQAHILEDMKPRVRGVEQSLQALGISRRD